MLKRDDTEFTEEILTGVDDVETGWAINCGGLSFTVPSTVCQVRPCVGEVVRFYGRGFGSPVRGVVIGGREYFYRTPDEQEQHHTAMLEQMNRERIVEFERQRPHLDADYESLPDIFKLRIDKFRRNNPEFRWKYEAYEMFCCKQAIVIANALKTPEAVKAFHGKEWAEQKSLVPGLSDGHSGNTFGCSVRLAYYYISNPGGVEQSYGALAPLVGSKAYGCIPSGEKDAD